MTTIAYVFLVLAVAVGCSPVDAANEIDIFLIGGQSNAQGAGGSIACTVERSQRGESAPTDLQARINEEQESVERKSL